jgi:superfamily II DNA or RNA helicase
LFCELIETAEFINNYLQTKGIKTGIYHSKMKRDERKDLLTQFKDDKIRIMIAVRCLDEGINVPDANVGIVIAGSSVSRQTIQRLGRILRPKEGKQARYYQFYVPNTKDEDWLHKRNQTILPMAENVIYEKWGA